MQGQLCLVLLEGRRNLRLLFGCENSERLLLCLQLVMARKTMEDHLNVVVSTCHHDGRKSNFSLSTLNLTFLPNLNVLSHFILRQTVREREGGFKQGCQFSIFVGQLVKCDYGRHGKHNFVSAFLWTRPSLNNSRRFPPLHHPQSLFRL